MFDDDFYGKMANNDGYDTIFMEWKYWMRRFSFCIKDHRWSENDDFMAYMRTPGRQDQFATYLMATLP